MAKEFDTSKKHSIIKINANVHAFDYWDGE